MASEGQSHGDHPGRAGGDGERQQAGHQHAGGVSHRGLSGGGRAHSSLGELVVNPTRGRFVLPDQAIDLGLELGHIGLAGSEVAEEGISATEAIAVGVVEGRGGQDGPMGIALGQG